MGCKKLLSMLSKQFTSLKRVLGDKGYRGKLQAWFFYITKGALLSISQNDKTNKGFQVHKWRWVIERSFAWLGNFRRLSKDYEMTTSSSIAMIQLAFIRIMLNKSFT